MAEQAQIIPLTDEEIAAVADDPAAVAKFTSDERRRMAKARSAAPSPSAPDGGVAGNVLTGVAKGAANTVTGLGRLAYDYVPGVQMASDAMQKAMFGDVIPGNKLLQSAQTGVLRPEGTAQKVGFTGEQLGEFFIPAAKAGVMAKVPGITRVIPAVQAALTTGAQGGSGTEAGLSGAITAMVPGGATLKKASGALETSAEKNIAQALGATTRDLKKEAMDIAPDVLKRGVRGSREAIRDRADSMVQSIGQKIGAEVNRAAQAGQTVDQNIIRGNIQLAKDALSERLGNGKPSVVPGYEQVASQLDKLDKYVEQLPAQIPFDQAHRLKMKWDAIVDAAGLFGTKGLTSAADKSKASAFETASGAFRAMLNNGNTTLADLNREFGFWKSLHKITDATTLRTQAQTGGLIRAGAATAGAASGFASGDSIGDSLEKGALGGVLGSQVVKIIQSPAFRTTVSAPLKQKLAEALASGSAERIASVVGRISAAMPAQFAQ